MIYLRASLATPFQRGRLNLRHLQPDARNTLVPLSFFFYFGENVVEFETKKIAALNRYPSGDPITGTWKHPVAHKRVTKNNPKNSEAQEQHQKLLLI